MRLKDKVTVLTGASSGIGAKTALRYAKEGAKVYAIARRLEKLESLADEAKEFEGKIYPLQGDVGIQEEVDNFINHVIEKEGKIDILINNAGILDDYKSVENITDELYERVMNVNVHGIVRTTRAVIPHMKEKKAGVILNTASIGGLYGMRGGMAYVASKHAVVGITKNVGFSYADYGIRCVAVAPGSIETEISSTVREPDMFMLQKLQKGLQVFNDTAKPVEIADIFVFLGSDEASFINGTTIVADGGWTAF